MRFEMTAIGEYATVQGGYAYKSQDFQSNGNWRVLKIKNVRNGYVDYGDVSYIADDIAMSTIKWVTKTGDILISMTGSGLGAPESLVGRVAKVWKGDAPALINQRVGRLCLKEDSSIDKNFLFYLLSLRETQEYLVSNSTGSANQVNISAKTIESVACPKAGLQNSKKIAAILGVLDERIRLLRETNATLEAIAQALFKSWFVDFDPVHAKQEGMSDATAALFPDSFEETELGLVPRGWGISAVYDLAQFINGAAYKAFEPNLDRRGLPIIKIAELKAGVAAQTAFSDVSMPEKYRIDTRDILFSWSGNPDTSIDIFVWPHGNAWLNQHIFRVVPNSANERSFVLLTLKYMKPIFAEIARNKQTTGLGHVTVADLKRLRVVKPNAPVLQRWNELVEPLIERAFIVEQQAQTLATLRDTLLPRLISGQLRLPEAQRAA